MTGPICLILIIDHVTRHTQVEQYMPAIVKRCKKVFPLPVGIGKGPPGQMLGEFLPGTIAENMIIVYFNLHDGVM